MLETKSGHTNERLPSNSIFTHLINGGSKDMNINGLSTPVNFRYTCPTDKVVFLYRINILIIDASMKMDKFGGLSALANGVEIGFYDSSDTLILDPTDGDNISIVADFSILAGVDAQIHVGAGVDAAFIRWTFEKCVGGPFRLNVGEYLQFKIRDNLSTIDEFHTMAQGIIAST